MLACLHVSYMYTKALIRKKCLDGGGGGGRGGGGGGGGGCMQRTSRLKNIKVTYRLNSNTLLL